MTRPQVIQHDSLDLFNKRVTNMSKQVDPIDPFSTKCNMFDLFDLAQHDPFDPFQHVY